MANANDLEAKLTAVLSSLQQPESKAVTWALALAESLVTRLSQVVDLLKADRTDKEAGRGVYQCVLLYLWHDVECRKPRVETRYRFSKPAVREGGISPPAPPRGSGTCWGGSRPPKTKRHSLWGWLTPQERVPLAGGGRVGGFRCTPPPPNHPRTVGILSLIAETWSAVSPSLLLWPTSMP
jgi:hypothetical protein